MSTSIISEKAIIGQNVKIGHFCIIEDEVEIGDNTTIEHYCLLKKGVKIGKDNVIKSNVELRENTVIGNNCYIDSKVCSSGNCVVGNNVTLRYETILARGVQVGDNSYLCPRVMTNNLNNSKDQIGGAKIGKNCFIGTHSVLQYGITIADNVTVGSMAFVNKNVEEGQTVVGIPAKTRL
jgi:UDP-3-O-[3-hydroxymyristoyl] glucosamine N-acyltransferase